MYTINSLTLKLSHLITDSSKSTLIIKSHSSWCLTSLVGDTELSKTITRKWHVTNK